ncbi:hypothetical protein BOW62_03530 [Chlamydia trachomatis]|nr:hypothetical protein BOW62_03530 [Chlamydia trachomatis]
MPSATSYISWRQFAIFQRQQSSARISKKPHSFFYLEWRFLSILEYKKETSFFKKKNGDAEKRRELFIRKTAL